MQTMPRGGREIDAFATIQGDRLSRMRNETSGDAAVAYSRSFSALKSANAPQAGIVAGNAEALRATPGKLANGSVAAGGTVYAYAQPAQRMALAEQFERESRFAAGKTFFQNGEKWIDSDVQKRQDARRVQVKFGSQEYFDLLKQQPQSRKWLAQGRLVEFVLGDTIYEVVD
jgi:hypothetical protein